MFDSHWRRCPSVHLQKGLKMLNKKSSQFQFVCAQCGAIHLKWLGKCPDCGSWNSIQQEIVSSCLKTNSLSSHSLISQKAEIISLPNIEKSAHSRFFCGIPELDRVLGGGLVAGSLILLSGDPGIGKSTLLLQALYKLAQRGFVVLYASGEESAQQIKLRADRLGALHHNIWVTNQTNILEILDAAKRTGPHVLVVDSIQTVYHPELSGTPGNVNHIRECTNVLMQTGKRENISTFVVGHVTKEGVIAGPKVLEHLVDTVLHLEGESSSGYRILRAHKNRFGSTGEIGVFAMQGHGLVDIPNPSALFCDQHRKNGEGAAICVNMEGSRPLFIEVQALVGKTSFAAPRRLATGFDTNRFMILLAVLEKRCGLFLSQGDVYAKVSGGFQVSETALDLAVAVAVASSVLGKVVPDKTAYFGEIGLTGELRMVNHALARIQEAQKLGLHKIFVPKRNYESDQDFILKFIEKQEKPFFVVPVEHLSEVLSFDN